VAGVGKWAYPEEGVAESVDQGRMAVARQLSAEWQACGTVPATTVSSAARAGVRHEAAQVAATARRQRTARYASSKRGYARRRFMLLQHARLKALARAAALQRYVKATGSAARCRRAWRRRAVG